MLNNQPENLLYIKNSKTSVSFLDHKRIESIFFPYQIVFVSAKF